MDALGQSPPSPPAWKSLCYPARDAYSTCKCAALPKRLRAEEMSGTTTTRCIGLSVILQKTWAVP